MDHRVDLAPELVRSSLIRAWQRGTELAAAIFSAVTSLCVLGIILTLSAGVISRYVLNDSLSWTDEASRFFFIYMIALSLPVAMTRDDQLALTILRDGASPGLRRALEVTAEAVVAFTLAMLLFSSFTLLRLVGGVTAALEVPNWLVYAGVPVGAGAAIALAVAASIARGRGWMRALLPFALGLLAFLVIDVWELASFRGLSPSLVMGVTFMVMILIGTPIAFAMLASTFLATLGADLLPAAAVVQNVVSGAGKYLLLAIPLFLMTGNIMNESGLSARLIDLAHALVGHLRGGLAQVNIVQSFLFGGISGSSTSDAALDSKILVPQMVRNGYRAEFSCAITAASAVLPNIVPPSIAILIYASIADLSVAKLFIAAVVPGCLLAICLMVAVYVLARRRGYGQGSARATMRRRFSAVGRATPVLCVIAIIILGLRFGVVTPTEAGVVAVLWSFLLWRVLAADFRWSGVYASFTSSASESATIGLLIGAATPFAYVLISERLPQAVVAVVMDGINEGWIVLLVMNLIMLAAGTVLNVSAAMLILMPLFLPVIAALGIDPIQFGLIVVVNLVMGGITPPVGVLVFITATITRTPVHLVFRETGPLLVALLIGLALITYIPAITLEPVRWTF